MDGNPMMRLHLWLETPEGLYFGLGRAQLLDLIERHGSLKKAADELNMSYRAAWGKIKKTEEVLGRTLIEKTAGNRHGYRLTEFGRQCSEAFVRWHQEVEAFALQRAREIIGDDIRGFEEKVGVAATAEQHGGAGPG